MKNRSIQCKHNVELISVMAQVHNIELGCLTLLEAGKHAKGAEDTSTPRLCVEASPKNGRLLILHIYQRRAIGCYQTRAKEPPVGMWRIRRRHGSNQQRVFTGSQSERHSALDRP